MLRRFQKPTSFSLLIPEVGICICNSLANASTSSNTVMNMPMRKGILKNKNDMEELQKFMQQQGATQKVPTKMNVVPLAQRFNQGGGIAKPEVDGQFKAHPIDFDVSKGGKQLRIKWKLTKVGRGNVFQPQQETVSTSKAAGDDKNQIDKTEGESSSSSTTPTDNNQDDTEGTSDGTQVAASADEPRYITTQISAELMRVCAPSTDVLSLPENVVVSGKRDVTFQDMHLVGNYALRVTYSDAHTAGIYGYQYLYDLSGPEKWMRSRHYLTTLYRSGRRRDVPKKK